MASKIVESTAKRMPPNAGKGRKKGVPNKVTSTVKEMIQTTLERAGGPDYLLQQAKENPTAFLTLVGKLIPSEDRTQVGILVNNVLGGRLPFEAILEKATYISGGFPDWQERRHRQIGQLFEAWIRGEVLPDPLIVGGFPDNLFAPAE